MRYRRITVAGLSIMVPVIILSILIYYFNQDKCPVGTFFCENSTICMPQRSWCNGEIDCPQGDDENITNCFDAHGSWDWFFKDREKLPDPVCDPLHCPKGCKCENCRVTCEGYKEVPRDLSPNVTTISLSNNSLNSLTTDDFTRYTEIRSLYLKYNNIKELQPRSFSGQSELLWLILSNNKISEIGPGHLVGLSSLETFLADNNQMIRADFSDLENSTTLEWVDLSKNALTHDNLIFPHLPALKELILNDNRIEKISSNFLSQLPALTSLSLEENDLVAIDGSAFNNMLRLTELNLAYNNIEELPENLFLPLQHLTKLMIGYNPIKDLQINVFAPLKNIQSLGVEEISMENTETNVFDQFKDLDFVYFKKFYYCPTYAPNVKKCRPASDGVSSLSHLLEKPILRAAVWGISLVTCLGNALVLWGRFTAKDENQVLSIMIRNLAVSDLLMGLYLMAIGFEDINFRNTYNKAASSWMSSWSCTILGIMAMTSSEVSVLILSFMSIERFILISAPLKGQQRALTPQAAASSMIAIWIFGVILALVPAIYWNSSTRFYGLNGMCFPLHIDDPFIVGWEYSAFIFLGINLFGLIIIGYVYAGMFISIWRTRHNTPLSIGDSEFALRFFLIVFTDAVCWAPIILLKIFAFLKYPVAPDLHAWVVVFILPVNSAINPLLYTFTTPKFRERLNDMLRKTYRNSSTKTSIHGSRASSVIIYNDKKIILPLAAITKLNSL